MQETHSSVKTVERYVILDIMIGNLRMTLGNVYGPNEDDPEFFQSVADIIENITNYNQILCGDFNLVLHKDLDKYGGRPA